MPFDAAIYSRLIWVFVIVFTALMPLICLLLLVKRSVEEEEYQSRVFSNQVIEGMETERQRIVLELHDMVLPLVNDAAVSERIRSICNELIPPDFARLSLSDSLRSLCAQFTKRTGIECVCSIEESLDFSFLGAEKQLHLYRIVQEALTNIKKHSGAEKAVVIARQSDQGNGNILICVSDDGRGLTQDAQDGANRQPSAAEGIGMKTMKQRAAIVGADLQFIGEEGNGLTVRVEISNEQ
uniref:histidine kinase n=1 Tax=uncultured bacterium contig00054 TaxID=1181538 RepID=A0A806KNR4_9BACT|nr:sensory box histidine kinase [uncultured bacterium contig00054]